MNTLAKRIVGYGTGSLAAVALVYCGYFHKTDADAMTLLSSAEVHMKLAKSIPKLDRQGQPNAVRAKLLGDARGFLERARRQEPGFYLVFELDAYLHAQLGQYSDAALLYAKAQGAREATAASRDQDVLNEVLMWRAAKKPERALGVLAREQATLADEIATRSQIEKALILAELGRAEEAVDIAVGVTESTKDPVSLADAGHILEKHEKWSAAESAFARAAEGLPLAHYFLARLKIRHRDYDTSLDLLRRALAGDERQVRGMLKHDRDIWGPVRDDPRFVDLTSPAGEVAEPGR